MKTFKDNEGRSWNVSVNVAAMKRVKTLLNLNLMDAVESDLIQRLATDPMLLCDVIYAICKPDADKRNVSDEQFGQSMAGDVIEHATKRQVLRKAVEKFKKVQTRAVETADKYLDSPIFEKRIEDALKNITDFSGNLPESSESILTP